MLPNRPLLKILLVSLWVMQTAVSVAAMPEAPDSAFLKLNRELSISRNRHDHGATSNTLFSLAILYKSAGDIHTAVTMLDSALVFSQKHNQFSNIARIYNTLGNIHLEGGDSSAASAMYQKAWLLGKEHHDNAIMGIALGNLAQLRKNEEDLKRDLRQAITLLRKTDGNEEETAQFLVNLGLTEPDPPKALNYFAEALATGKKGSYAVLQLGAYNNMAYSLLDAGNSDSALRCIVAYAIPLAKSIGSHDWLATLYDTQADILMSKNKFSQAASSLKMAMAEKARDDYEKSMEQVRLLAAILDTRNKDAALEKSVKDLRYNRMIIKFQYLAGAALVLAAGLVVMLLLWRHQRRKIALKNKEIALTKRIIAFDEKQTAILGRELHDAVSSVMQRMAGFLTNNRSSDLHGVDPADQHLENLLFSMRSISHRMNRLDFKSSTLKALLTELAADMVNLTGINLNMNLPERLPAFSEDLSRNVYRIVQELLTNAGKHARGAQVQLSVGVAGTRLVILYQDNGPGINDHHEGAAGIGVTGISERAESFGGTAKLENTPGSGLSWFITIPVSSGNSNFHD